MTKRLLMLTISLLATPALAGGHPKWKSKGILCNPAAAGQIDGGIGRSSIDRLDCSSLYWQNVQTSEAIAN